MTGDTFKSAPSPSLLCSRKSRFKCATAVMMLLLAGCATTGPSTTDNRPQPKTSQGLFAERGAPWTIRCMEVTGEGRVASLNRVAEVLKQTPGVRASDVVVRDEEDGVARLYYGEYRRKSAPAARERAITGRLREDLTLIRELGMSDGRRLFLQAIPVHMPQPNVGNPAWDLRRIPAKYSLQVAVFEPTDEFWETKQAAADFCAWLREKEYEAYYYHGPASSLVTVGAFGTDAVVSRLENGAYRTYYSPAVLQLQRDELLQHNLLNGSVYKVRDDQGRFVPMASRLVEIPAS